MAFIIDASGTGSFENIPAENPNPERSLVAQLLEEFEPEPCPENQTVKKGANKVKPNSLVEHFDELGWNGKRPKKPTTQSLLQEWDTLHKTGAAEALKAAQEPKAVPLYRVTDKALKKQHKEEAERTKGKKWFGMAATEMTEEVKRDLQVLQMRSVLDPKRFYKKNDLKVLPKYFQIGKVLDSPLDYYSNRLTKKQRKRTIVDELLADAEFKQYNKRKFKDIISEQPKTIRKQIRKQKRKTKK